MRPADLYQRGTGRAIVILGLVTFVLGVYVVVVLGGGVLIGRTDSPSPALSVLATTVVALAFAPVQSALERAALRMATPYDVLTRFTESLGEDGSEDLPARMSRLLAQGTGAQWAQVWLVVSGNLAHGRTLAARHGWTQRWTDAWTSSRSALMVCARCRSSTATGCSVSCGSRSGRDCR